MRIFGTLIAIAVMLAVGAWFGLPPLFKSMGLHPAYTGPAYELPGGKVLIITTSQATLAPRDTATGVFASEMTAPYYVFKDGGMKVDIASIKAARFRSTQCRSFGSSSRLPIDASRPTRSFSKR